MIDLNETTYKIKPLQPSSLFEKDFAKLLENKLSVKNLFYEIENYKKFIKTKK